MSGPVLNSVLTCPSCGFGRSEAMPTDACLFFYNCTNCGALLEPKPGNCCVFCSYGSVKCPSTQTQRSCCGNLSLNTIKEINMARVHGVLCPHHDESVLPNELLRKP